MVSGERLAGDLSLSRTAVWKHITALKREGYDIESETGAGHRLIQCADVLSPDEIACRLTTNTFGRWLQCLGETPSTNDVARAWALDGAPEGATVLADSQTRGRGRHGRRWASAAGAGAYRSVVLRPPFSPGELGLLSLAAALATVRAIREATGVAVGAKWPNDLVVEERKLGGILLEAETDLESVRSAIVGIGLNVAGAPEQLPPGATLPSTSLAALGNSVRRVPLVCELLKQLETTYHLLCRGESSRLLAEYLSLETTLGQPVTVRVGDQAIEGLVQGLSPQGALEVRTGAGEERSFVAGEVTLARDWPTEAPSA